MQGSSAPTSKGTPAGVSPLPHGPGLEAAVRDLQPYPVDRIIDASTTDFDLFLGVEGRVELYAAKGYQWSRAELSRLLRLGYESFLVRAADLRRTEMYERVSRLPMIDEQLAPPDRLRSIEQVGAAFVKCLYDGELTQACVAKARNITDSMVNCIAEDPGCIKALSGLAEHDYYTYYHSVRVSSYATAIGVQMGLSKTEAIRDLAIGGIFHDIGKSQMPLAVLNKSGPLTDEEWQAMRDHPRRGFDAISPHLLGFVPREVVLHHHEKLDGSGYPDKLEGSSLIDEVRIATVADIFDALTSARAYHRKRSRYEALDLMKHSFLKPRLLAIDSFKALVECLAA